MVESFRQPCCSPSKATYAYGSFFSETFIEACKEKKLPYAYVAFEGEQHGWRKDSTIKRAMELELCFMSRIFDFEAAGDIDRLQIENFTKSGGVGERI